MTNPIPLRRQAMRAAVKIHERLAIPTPVDYVDRLPRSSWDRLRTILWRLRKVEVRGWRAAARELREDLDFQIPQLVRELESLQAALPRPAKASQIAPPSQIMADLLALPEEFEEVAIDLQVRTVTVATEPITLKGVWLGPFDICLHWERIGARRTYDVIAKDSQHPPDREEISHPHVSDKVLCEGDAAVPIRRALSEGRLLDFFLVVRQTLETYNPASPYVSLDHWNGATCHDCGYGMSEDEGATCERCDAHVCDECYYTCQGCDCYLCSECSGECTECNHRFCRVCLGTPAEAAQTLCPSCLQKGQASDDEDQFTGESPPVHAICLGQIAAAA